MSESSNDKKLKKWIDEQAIPEAITKGLKSNKVAVITGASPNGLGCETAKMLVYSGCGHVILGCRSEQKANDAIKEIEGCCGEDAKVENIPLELDDLESVKAFADTLKSKFGGDGGTGIHYLINNAGIMMLPERKETKQGFELQVGVNHIGHFVLTAHLLPLLLQGASTSSSASSSASASPPTTDTGCRIVNVASLAESKFAPANGVDLDNFPKWDAPGSYGSGKNYGISKLSNVLFTKELNRRLEAAGKGGPSGVRVMASHPGMSQTNLTQSMSSFLNTVAQWAAKVYTRPLFEGAAPSVAATLWTHTEGFSKGEELKGGEYFGPNGFQEVWGAPKVVKPHHKLAEDPDTMKKLFDETERVTGVTFDI